MEKLTDSQEKLFLDNMNLVYHVCNKYKRTYQFYDEDDIYALGFMGLTKAVRTYDNKMSKFSTYAYRCIQNELLMEINNYKKASKYLQNPIADNCFVYLDKMVDEQADLYFHDIIADEKTEHESKLLTQMDIDYCLKLLYNNKSTSKNKDRDCSIFYDYYVNDMLFDKIASKHGISRQRACFIVSKQTRLIKRLVEGDRER